MDKETILLFLKNNKPFINKQFGVLKIGLFGSYARNQATSISDIDLIVEFREPKYEYWSNLKTYIENSLHSKTDIISFGNHLSKTFLSQINNDTIYV